MSTEKSLQEQAQEILKLAEESGVQGNFFFRTTFDRYLTQLSILEQLKAAIDADGMLVSKEYVKGRKNLYSNPAIAAYNRTVDSANKTVATLMRIIKDFYVEEPTDETDPLLRAINGGDPDE